MQVNIITFNEINLIKDFVCLDELKIQSIRMRATRAQSISILKYKHEYIHIDNKLQFRFINSWFVIYVK